MTLVSSFMMSGDRSVASIVTQKSQIAQKLFSFYLSSISRPSLKHLCARLCRLARPRTSALGFAAWLVQEPCARLCRLACPRTINLPPRTYRAPIAHLPCYHRPTSVQHPLNLRATCVKPPCISRHTDTTDSTEKVAALKIRRKSCS